MKVEIGAGARKKAGWIAVDLNPRYADVAGDALHLPFDDGTVEELRAVDVLEHVSYRDTARALREWARVLRSRGVLFVQVPDADTIMRWYVYGNERLSLWENNKACRPLHGVQWRLLGGHADGKYVDGGDDWRYNAHYSLWDRESIVQALVTAGFWVTRIDKNLHPNLLVSATKQ